MQGNCKLAPTWATLLLLLILLLLSFWLLPVTSSVTLAASRQLADNTNEERSKKSINKPVQPPPVGHKNNTQSEWMTPLHTLLDSRESRVVTRPKTKEINKEEEEGGSWRVLLFTVCLVMYTKEPSALHRTSLLCHYEYVGRRRRRRREQHTSCPLLLHFLLCHYVHASLNRIITIITRNTRESRKAPARGAAGKSAAPVSTVYSNAFSLPLFINKHRRNA